MALFCHCKLNKTNDFDNFRTRLDSAKSVSVVHLPEKKIMHLLWKQFTELKRISCQTKFTHPDLLIKTATQHLSEKWLLFSTLQVFIPLPPWRLHTIQTLSFCWVIKHRKDFPEVDSLLYPWQANNFSRKQAKHPTTKETWAENLKLPINNRVQSKLPIFGMTLDDWRQSL